MNKRFWAAMTALALALALAAASCSNADVGFLDGPNAYLGMKKPGNKPVVFAPGLVSTPRRQEVTIAFSPDGTMCVFTVGSWPDNSVLFSEFKDGSWTPPAKIGFSEGRLALEASFSPDGTRIYFCSSEKRGGMGSADLWYVERQGSGWGDIVNLGSSVNTENDEFHPSVVADGSVYFTDYQGNVAVCRFGNGRYAERVVLPAPVNLADVRSWNDPYVSPDESLMFIKSQRPGGAGMVDAFVSFRNADGTWGEPRNLGKPFNTSGMEASPDLSPDGKYVFYAIDGDIYWVKSDFLKKLKR